MAAAGLDRVNMTKSGLIFRQNWHQTPGFKRRLDDEGGLVGDADRLRRYRSQHLAVVGVRAAFNSYLQLVSLSIQQWPVIFHRCVLVGQTIMFHQFLKAFWGAASFETGRRRRRDQPHLAKFACDQVGIAQIADANCPVQSFLHPIDKTIGCGNVE